LEYIGGFAIQTLGGVIYRNKSSTAGLRLQEYLRKIR
jgi:hypothetical protein